MEERFSSNLTNPSSDFPSSASPTLPWHPFSTTCQTVLENQFGEMSKDLVMPQFASPGNELCGIRGHPLYLSVEGEHLYMLYSGIRRPPAVFQPSLGMRGAGQRWHNLIFLCKESMSAFDCHLPQQL